MSRARSKGCRIDSFDCIYGCTLTGSTTETRTRAGWLNLSFDRVGEPTASFAGSKWIVTYRIDVHSSETVVF